MKINNLFKSIPFLTTLLVIMLLIVSNNKESTRLKILIWSTPSISLGSYLALSTGTGFILSFIITSNLAKIHIHNTSKNIRYKDENNLDSQKEYISNENNINYDKILIERDINDPSPTINANFRVIGKNNRNNQNLQYSIQDDYLKSDLPYQKNETYNSEEFDETRKKESYSSLNDWDDDSFTNW